jgi:hypothetical protein
MTRAKLIAIFLAALLCAASVMCPGMTTRAAGQGATPSASAQLSDNELRQMLDGLGLEPKPLSKGFLVVIQRDGWTSNIQVVLSENKEKLGLNANLGSVKDPDSVTAAQWKALMVANGNIEPSFFYFNAEQKKLYLHRAMNNRGLTPAYLRTQIDSFFENMRSTEGLWKFTG